MGRWLDELNLKKVRESKLTVTNRSPSSLGMSSQHESRSGNQDTIMAASSLPRGRFLATFCLLSAADLGQIILPLKVSVSSSVQVGVIVVSASLGDCERALT